MGCRPPTRWGSGEQLGPRVVALVVELHTKLGVPLPKVAHLLRTTFGLQVTPGGLAQVLHRAARAAARAYTALCEQGVAVHLATEFLAVFLFLWDATNWRAEQAIRPVVVIRKVCGGNRNRHGADTQQVLARVVRTARQRGLDLPVLIAAMLCATEPAVAELSACRRRLRRRAPSDHGFEG